MENQNTRTLKTLPTLDKVTRWSAPSNREDLINLNLNEGMFDKKDLAFFKKFANFSSTVITQYPEYDTILGLLAGYTHTRTQEIILTNGADQGIDLVCRLFFNKDSNVLVPSPVFSYYYHVLDLLGSTVTPVFYRKKENTFEFPLDEIIEKIPESSGVILCNPNNPLGTAIDLTAIEQIVQRSQHYNIPVIIDEAYFEYHGETSIPLLKTYKNIIIIRTFSKFFCLAGLRLGYAIAAPEIIKGLLKIRGPWDVNHFSIFAGSLCLQNIDFFDKKRSETDEHREIIESCLHCTAMISYECKTNFMVVDQRQTNYTSVLKADNIIVSDLSAYPYSNNLLQDHIRITIPGTDFFDLLIKTLSPDTQFKKAA